MKNQKPKTTGSFKRDNQTRRGWNTNQDDPHTLEKLDNQIEKQRRSIRQTERQNEGQRASTTNLFTEESQKQIKDPRNVFAVVDHEPRNHKLPK